jgi:hypothetical protein
MGFKGLLIIFISNNYGFNNLKDVDWTEQETRYFWDLCKQFELRFIVIYDRYDDRY